MKRTVLLAVILACVVASCGGGQGSEVAADDVGAVSDQPPDADRACAIEARLHDLLRDGPFRADPEEARAVASEVRGLLDEMAVAAPSDVRPSVAVLAINFGLLLDIYEAADFDMAALDARLVNELVEVDAAGVPTPGAGEQADDALAAWVSETCNVADRNVGTPTTTFGG